MFKLFQLKRTVVAVVEEEGVKVGVVIFISGLVPRFTNLVLVFNGTILLVLTSNGTKIMVHTS